MQSNHSPDTKGPGRRFSAAIRLGLVAAISLVGAGLGASACLDRPLCSDDCRPRTTNIFVDTITQKSIDKIDLLFMIDNSISMADKQEVLKEAVPDLVQRLVSPNCVDPTTAANPVKLADPSADCPSGKTREFTPIKDIHIGVITSSLGDHGDNATCLGKDGGSIHDEEQDDHGHLIASRPRWASAKPDVAGAQFQPPEQTGFLDWNPTTRHPGQSIDAFNTTFKMMVIASSEFGCGLEAQLESVYRFLADPSPPTSIGKQPCSNGATQQCAFPQGKDTVLLAQRAAFLRPDSLVAAILVSDENDCSIRDERQFFYAATNPAKVLLPHGSAACAANPNDPCCYSCGGTAPANCPKDPSCTPATSDGKQDVLNLRCFDQKRRFGLDFLYPIQRYVNALSKPQLCLTNPDLSFDPGNAATCPGGEKNIATNPLFADLTSSGALPRDPSLVFLAGIVGVPWQDIQATQSAATPTVPSITYPANELHYLTAQQMTDNKTWDLILGDPLPGPGAAPRPPTDGLMVESRYPRGGNDVFGKPVLPASTPVAQNSPINGHEWMNTANDDLMYACIFPLKAPRDCLQVEMIPAGSPTPAPGCDCGQDSNPSGDFNPLCESPAGAYGNTQYFAKGYPGTRELQTLKAFGNNSIVASICARNLADANQQDYGYRPAVDSIVDRLKEALTGRCLPRKLAPDPTTGKIPCSILEVRPPGAATAGCDPSKGRLPPSSKVLAPAKERLKDKGICDTSTTKPCSTFTLCEIKPLNNPTEDPTQACHKDGIKEPQAGWCYVDPEVKDANGNSIDDPSLVSKCQASERRIIRFVDPANATPAQGAQVLIACFGAQIEDTKAAPAGAVTGAGGAVVDMTGAGGAIDMTGAGGDTAAAGAGGGP
jgi:hypothetical protein